jgi:hypothetical protein
MYENYKYQYVELLIQVGQAQPQFTPQQYLRNRPMMSVDAFNNADISGTKSNVAMITPAMMEGMFATFYCTDSNYPLQASSTGTGDYNGQAWGYWHRDVPLVKMHCVSAGTNAYVRDPYLFNPLLIDFEQSYVYIDAAAQALITTGGVPVIALFGFGYK